MKNLTKKDKIWVEMCDNFFLLHLCLYLSTFTFL